MKTCNNFGNCAYKTMGTTSFGCNYSYYCDFQAPRDSINAKISWPEKYCSCGTSMPCEKHGVTKI